MTCCCEITDLPICLEKKEFIDFRFTTTNKIKVIYSLSWRRHIHLTCSGQSAQPHY